MTSPWELPRKIALGGKDYEINGDFRDVLEIFSYFDDPDLPPFLQWEIALALFYREPVPEVLQQEAMEQLCRFIRCGAQEPETPAKPLISWQQDAPLIVADVNKVAGQEIRALPFLHWWTFMAYFNAVGEGQLSALLSIRDKLSRRQKLEDWEKTYYREHRHQVDIKPRYSTREQRQKDRLEQMLAGK